MKPESVIPEYMAFLAELDRNNNREWFHAHKQRYDELQPRWLDELTTLAAAMGQWEPRVAYLTGRDCAYRIYRDTRFSVDKRPYKSYISASVNPFGKNMAHAGYYVQFGLDKEESGLYGGLWCPDAQMLRKLRRAIVDNAEEWEEIVNAPDLASLYPDWVGRRLKTAPKGYDRNDPLIDYLRLCDIGKRTPMTPAELSSLDWPLIAASRLRPLKPLVDFINYSLDEI